jgi:hypothetical protein
MANHQRPLAGDELQRRQVCFRGIHVQGTQEKANGESGFQQARAEGFIGHSHALSLGQSLGCGKRKPICPHTTGTGTWSATAPVSK